MGSALDRLLANRPPDTPRTTGGPGPAALKEKRSRWDFTAAGDEWLWRLQCHDGAKITSSLRFSTMEACVENAVLHGYVVWRPDRERRAGPH